MIKKVLRLYTLTYSIGTIMNIRVVSSSIEQAVDHGNREMAKMINNRYKDMLLEGRYLTNVKIQTMDFVEGVE